METLGISKTLGINETSEFIVRAVTQYKKLQEQNRIRHNRYNENHKKYVNQKKIRKRIILSILKTPIFWHVEVLYFKQRYLKRKVLKLQTL